MQAYKDAPRLASKKGSLIGYTCSQERSVEVSAESPHNDKNNDHQQEQQYEAMVHTEERRVRGMMERIQRPSQLYLDLLILLNNEIMDVNVAQVMSILKTTRSPELADQILEALTSEQRAEVTLDGGIGKLHKGN